MQLGINELTGVWPSRYLIISRNIHPRHHPISIDTLVFA